MKTLLFLTGLSGSGKGYFKENILPIGLFYPLKSMTTRNIRDGEIDGVHYDFKTEYDFENTKFVTYLDVNKDLRKPGDTKWLYGVSEKEFISHKNNNLVYDVIQPIYIKQMIDWCRKNKLEFDIRVLYFIQPNNGFDIAKNRAGMKNDINVRQKNTANISDFKDAGVNIDWAIKNSADEMVFDKSIMDCINKLSVKENKDIIKPDARIQIIKNSMNMLR